MVISDLKKIEYCYKSYNGYSINKIVDDMNKLGQDGWELVINIKDELGMNRYIFKREITTKRI